MIRDVLGWIVWALLAVAAVVWCAACEFFTDEED